MTHQRQTAASRTRSKALVYSTIFGALAYSGLIAIAALIVLTLSACSGGQTEQNSKTPLAAAPAQVSTSTIEFKQELSSPTATQQIAQPSFHIAPVMLEAPADEHLVNSAHKPARQEMVSLEALSLSKRGAPINTIQAGLQRQKDIYAAMVQAGITPPPTASAMVSTYTPAQIRAAYGLPALATGTSYTAAQAASLGAGQTIYIVDAMRRV